MFGSSPSQSDPPSPLDLTQFLAVVEALRQQIETLQDRFHILQTHSQEDEDAKEEM